MDYIGSDFNSTGSVIPKSELTAARLKRGECVTCGRKCYKKKLFKMIPIDDKEGRIRNGRCLHCSPLHSKNKNKKSTACHKNNNTGRKPQRSTSYPPDGARISAVEIAKSKSNISCYIGDTSHPPSLDPPSPPRSQPTNHPLDDIGTTDINQSKRSERSTENAPLNRAIKSGQNMKHDPFHNGKNNLAYARVYRSPSSLGSFHSITSSSVGSLDSSSSTSIPAITRNFQQHHHRPSSSQNSMGSNSIGSISNASSQLQPSQKELKRAALMLMSIAQEHGLADAGGTLASSLQNIVNVGMSIDESVVSDSTYASTTIVTNDDRKLDDYGSGSQVNQAKSGEKGGVLDRGGAFPMRYGRLIYTGSNRTLSSMSSIDEGDRHHLTAFMQSAQLQQTLRAAGKSSRTLGSLSTIDGTDEEEINSLTGKKSKGHNGSRNIGLSGHERVSPYHRLGSIPTFPSNGSKVEESLVSAALIEKEIPVKRIHKKYREEIKEYGTEFKIYLQQLKDSIDSFSPVRAMNAMGSLSKFLALFYESPSILSDLCVERDLVKIILTIMGKYTDSSQIQIKACEVLSHLVVYDKGLQRSTSISLRRSRIIVELDRAAETILFSSMVIHEGNPTVQKAALQTIRDLCKDCEENQTIFWKLDAIEPILRAMEHHQNEPIVQETGAAVVSMLANNPNNKNAKGTIGLNGGISVVIQAISIHLENLQVVESCIYTLYTLIMEYIPNIIVVLKAPGAANIILDAIQSHNQSLVVQEIGCAILANLTIEPEHIDILLGNDGPMGTEIVQQYDDSTRKPDEILSRVIEITLEAIQTHSSIPTIQDFGFTVLSNLTDSDETKMFIVDMGALDAIVLSMVLHKDDVGLQERICGLLLILAIQENHQQILAANPIELVKTAGNKFPEECLEPARRLIKQLGLD